QVNEVATLMTAEARRRGVALEVRDSRVLGDETQIQQVLINLVLNAMDAVAEVEPEQRVVLIATEPVDDRIRVIVRDRGKGIAAQDVAKVFDSFYSTKPNGMGLGLSIARTIVEEAHDGRIFVKGGVDAGATFCF